MQRMAQGEYHPLPGTESKLVPSLLIRILIAVGGKRIFCRRQGPEITGKTPIVRRFLCLYHRSDCCFATVQSTAVGGFR